MLICLQKPTALLPFHPVKNCFKKITGDQTILVKDITGFRRYSKFRPAAEITYGAVAIGIAGTVTAVIAQADLPAALSFVTAAGTSTVTGIVGRVIIGNKVKNKLPNGWSMQLQPVQ